MSFFSELRRRNVFKVGFAYVVSAWVLLQVVDLVLENISAPDWVMQVFMLAVAIGFPFALIFAWAFEMTPEGLKLEKDVDKGQSISKQTGQRLMRNTAIALAIAVVLLLVDRFRLEQPTEPLASGEDVEQASAADAAGPAEKSIAVLPFRDMSAARDQAYFGEGIAEELLNALVKIEGLEVASRTSAFSLADDGLDIPAIAARLGVTNILEGSVRTSGRQVRVTAQLIDVSKDVHLWSETYDGSLDDIFKIQDEITSQISEAMKVQLGSGILAPSSELLTDNAEAYQLYLRGRHLWRQRSPASLKQAVQLFGKAVELDPEFHQAWSNLAIAYLNLPDYDRSFGVEEGFERGLEAAEKALAIWPQSTEALIITANYNEYHCNITEAARLYEKAIALDPLDPTAHHWYAILLSTTGRTTQALEQIQTAKRIDPLISAVIAIEAEIYRNLGDYARAEELYRTASSLGMHGGSLLPVGMNFLFAGEIEKGAALTKPGQDGQDPGVATGRKLLVQAMKDPAQQEALERHIGKADAVESFVVIDNMELLSILGSPYLFEYLADLSCPILSGAVWSESFREQRKTPEFFDLAERASVVEYWREFGWPDDCASLDQTLAECP
ncbi:MAG: tetratricopeptide repeat protein [Xanthomonadales bacterium]|nr:tetratricopeptide repeat protein [Xanthomonadales bacterium]